MATLGLVAGAAAQGEPAKTPWPDFPAFVWRLDAPGEELPEALVEAFGGVNVEGMARGEWAHSKGRDFDIGHAPGRDALHLDL